MKQRSLVTYNTDERNEISLDEGQDDRLLQAQCLISVARDLTAPDKKRRMQCTLQILTDSPALPWSSTMDTRSISLVQEQE